MELEVKFHNTIGSGTRRGKGCGRTRPPACRGKYCNEQTTDARSCTWSCRRRTPPTLRRRYPPPWGPGGSLQASQPCCRSTALHCTAPPEGKGAGLYLIPSAAMIVPHCCGLRQGCAMVPLLFAYYQMGTGYMYLQERAYLCCLLVPP